MPSNIQHCVILAANGYEVYSVGKNETGELGTGDIDTRDTFIQITLPVRFCVFPLDVKVLLLDVQLMDRCGDGEEM